MSTPASDQPRLPDAEKQAEGEVPDLDRAHRPRVRPRIGDEEKGERIPDPEE
jgi:hypothetical protein